MREEEITDAINNITSSLSKLLLNEFLKLPKELQIGLVLTRTTQLLMANILCQVADSNNELDQLMNEHISELKDLTLKCAAVGYAKKFNISKH